MIYIIDEKTNRQSSFGWNAEKFEKYKELIYPIHDYAILSDNSFVNAVFSIENVVLLHESFFNGINLDNKAMANDFQNKLDSFANEGKIFVAYYGGSKRSRKIDGNKAYLPVSVFYEHLEVYLENCQSGKMDINYLLWGDNPQIEKQLTDKIKEANEKMQEDQLDYSSVDANVLILTTADSNRLVLPGLRSRSERLFPDPKASDPISDELLHSKVTEWLSDHTFNAIILPLCIGPVLSDYNGLRLATHIRCTVTPNQNVPIYIYSVVDLSFIIGNDYFDIIKTNGVFLIGYDNMSIKKAIIDSRIIIEKESLITEMKKVHLSIPKNYIDNHSISNEWAIYRWAKTIDVKDKDIKDVIKTVESNLYFKYLNTIYPVLPQGQMKEQNLTISTNLSKKPKVLLVDDEAEKGWYKIFYKIIDDINKFDFCRLDDEFNGKTQDEIVDIVHNKIVDDDIDIVILDYRLHKDDFFVDKITKVTGYKVLDNIKNNINRGVQVVVLSATNKIWNWEKLQEVGADAFIMKDNPESNYEDLTTIKTIQSFISQLDECCVRLFLKQFYDNYKKLESSFLPRRSKKSSAPLPKEFVDEAMKWFKISCDLFKSGVTEENKAAAFLFLFSVIENIANRVINIDVPENDMDNLGNAIWKYKFRSKNQYIMSFDTNMNKTQYPLIVAYGKPIPWIQKILNAFDFISVYGVSKDIKDLVDKRNNFIHANATTGKKINITESDVITLHDIVFDGLINIK